MADLITGLAAQHEAYLSDESKYRGFAEEIAFPKTEEDIATVLISCLERKLPVTVQGGRTGIVGGAVPQGGLILNLTRMDRITGLRREGDAFYVEAQPGVLLSSLQEQLQKRRFQTEGWSEASLAALQELRKAPEHFFPPAPTESSATIGGMVATNAKGTRRYSLGRTGEYVNRLRLMAMDGTVLDVERGKFVADEQGITLPNGRVLPCAARAEAPLMLVPGQDLIDLIVGSEGMLGVITSVELKVIARAPSAWGLMFFFPGEEEASSFLNGLDRQSQRDLMLSVEYFDQTALELVSDLKKQISRLRSIPEIPQGCHAGVYLELEAEDEDTVELALGEVLEFFVECGGDEEATWAASGEAEMEKFHLFRHAVPEAINQKVDSLRRSHPQLHKLSVDFRRAGMTPGELIAAYRADAVSHQVPAVIFGHAADLHLHVNLLPETPEQMEEARVLLNKWAEQTACEGGCLVAEHGIGKVKAQLVTGQISKSGSANMQSIKGCFDPDLLWNRGNMGFK